MGLPEPTAAAKAAGFSASLENKGSRVLATPIFRQATDISAGHPCSDFSNRILCRALPLLIFRSCLGRLFPGLIGVFECGQ